VDIRNSVAFFEKVRVIHDQDTHVTTFGIPVVQDKLSNDLSRTSEKSN
jgi:hypothetical protein